MRIAPLYICDLDGTLLGSDGALSEFARDGLNELLRAGVRLTVASSRATPAMRTLLAGVNLELPVIEFNGAIVSELESGRHLASNVLSKSAACAAVEAIRATGADPVVSAWDGSRDRVHFGRRMNEGTGWYVEEKRAYGDPRLTACDDLLDAVDREEVASIVGFVRDTEAAALDESLREAVSGEAVVYCAQNYYCPGWTEVQIQDCAAEKGAALSSLLTACGAIGADVVACGDHLNDLGLFAWRHRASLRQMPTRPCSASATVVVGSNDEDGLVRHLLDLNGSFPEGSR